MDTLTYTERAHLMRMLRGDRKLNGFIGSMRVALETGLPCMAYHARTKDRLLLRRPLPTESTPFVVEHTTVEGVTKILPHPRRKGGARNTTIRLQPEMRARIEEIGEVASVVRAALERHLDELEAEAKR